MSIKTDQIVSNQLLPLSQLSTIGTENNAWDKLYGSFASFTFPAGSPADLNQYWQHSRLYASDPLNFEGYINGPAGHTPEVGDLLIVLPENGTSQKQILITPATTYQRSGTNQGDWNEWIELLTTGNYAKWVPKLDGSNVDVMSTWPINISGNAVSADTATVAHTLNISGADSRGILTFISNSGEEIEVKAAAGIKVHSSGNNSYIAASDFKIGNQETSLSDSKISLAGVPVSIINGEIDASTLRTNLGLSLAFHYIGVATTPIKDGSTTDPQIGGYDFINNRTPGDVVLWLGNEYIWSTEGRWEILGEGSSFKLKQENVSSQTITPILGGNTFISDIDQDQNGIITLVKKQIAPLTIGSAMTTYDGGAETILSLSDIGAVAKTGDIMTGQLNIQNNAPAVTVRRPKTDGSTGYDQRITLGINKNNYGGLWLNDFSKWMIVADPNGNVAINGNANTADKVNNTLTINNRGKNIVFDGSTQKSLTINKRCTVGRFNGFSDKDSNGNFTSAYYVDAEKTQLKSWQKVASVIVSHQHADREIVFKVSQAINAHKVSGILRAHVRTNGIENGVLKPAFGKLYWEYANKDIVLNNFMMTITPDNAAQQFLCEIWIDIHDSSWMLYHFDVIQEHDRSATGDDNYWTLYSRLGNKEEDWEYFSSSAISNGILSELLDIKNNAETATTLQNLTASITELNYMNGVTDNIQIQFNNLNTALTNYLPLAGGIVTGATTFYNDIIKTTDDGAHSAGKWSANNLASILQIGDYNGGLKGQLKLYETNGNYIQLIPGTVNSGGTTINLTLPGTEQTLIGTAGSAAIEGPLTPATTQTYDLGSSDFKWNNIYATNFYGNASTATSLSGVRDANTVLAAPNGSNGTATFRKLVAADLPIASATEAGIITTGTQSLAGNKTFTGNLVMTKNGGMIKISSKTAYDDGTTYSVALCMDSDLVNRGLFDATNNQWMLYKGAKTDVIKTPSLFQAPRIILTNTTDAKLEKYDTVALTIGSSAAQHLEFDTNEIVSKDSASTAGVLGLNVEGSVQLGKMILQPSNYGILAPTDSNNTKTSSPVKGQIYFQLIEQ